MNDQELLQAWATSGSEESFRRLVERYLPLVYSVAHRRLNDPQLAQDVCQVVFCLLARKARRLSKRSTVAGWLFQATWLTAAKAVRTEIRRRKREELAHSMSTAKEDHDETPEQLTSMLDEAVQSLGEGDRLAILLRFHRRQSMREVGVGLCISEDAAKMRVSRALERLRRFFHARGIPTSAAAVAMALTTQTVEAVPSSLSAGVMAVVQNAASSTLVPGLSALATSVSLMTAKTKSVIAVGAAVALWFLAGTLIYLTRPVPETGSQVAVPSKAGDASPPATAAAPPQPRKRGLFASIATAPLNWAAVQALKAALHAPREQGTISYPSAAIQLAMKMFVGRDTEAFAVLAAALKDDDLEVRLRAISAMGGLGDSATLARPLLWQILRAGEEHTSDLAMLSLANARLLSAQDIPALAALLPGQTAMLRRYLPQTIARVISQDNEAAQAQLPALADMLASPDESMRLAAACALLKSSQTDHPQIVEILQGALQSKDVQQAIMVVDTCEQAGDAAKALAPALLDYARSANEVLGNYAKRTAGKVDPTLRDRDPAVSLAVAQEEQRAAWYEKYHSDALSQEDLAQGLKDPNLAVMAAERLGKLGANASANVPDLVKALTSQSRGYQRDKILAAIHEIDPALEIVKIDRRPIIEGITAAANALNQSEQDGNETLVLALHRQRQLPEWLTLEELQEATRLARQHPVAWQAFLDASVSIEPRLKNWLATDTQASTYPNTQPGQ